MTDLDQAKVAVTGAKRRRCFWGAALVAIFGIAAFLARPDDDELAPAMRLNPDLILVNVDGPGALYRAGYHFDEPSSKVLAVLPGEKLAKMGASGVVEITLPSGRHATLIGRGSESCDLRLPDERIELGPWYMRAWNSFKRRIGS